MANDEKRIWGIHTQDDNLFLKGNVIAIGWHLMGDLRLIEASRDGFKDKYMQTYPDAKKGSIATGAGMLFRFCYEVQIGDYVIFPSKSNREVNIGIVEGDYVYDPSQVEYVQTRRSAMSFFAVKNYADEFLAALSKNFKKSIATDIDDESVGATAEDIIENTKDFILKELSRQLKGYELEQFVADLLQAMGYRTKVSPQGGDSGIDITAYKDELPPRILVQVKSQDSDIKETTIQSLKGAMREGDYGLFITLSNYTKNAKKYLDNTPIIRGINGTELVELILKYYEDLSEKYRKMIPLKRVYIPVPKEAE